MTRKITDHPAWLYTYYTRYDNRDFEKYALLMQFKEFTLAQQIRFYIDWFIEYGWPDNTYSVY